MTISVVCHWCSCVVFNRSVASSCYTYTFDGGCVTCCVFVADVVDMNYFVGLASKDVSRSLLLVVPTYSTARDKLFDG